MTSTEQVQPAASMPTSRKVLCAVYALIALIALGATWSQTVAYTHSGAAFFFSFWQDTRVNAASRNITADALMLSLSVVILMVLEARKRGVRFVWLYVLGGVFVAISVTVPLFLIAREIRMGSAEPPRLRPLDVILLVVTGAGAIALTFWVDIG